MSIRQRLYPSPRSIPMLAKHCQDARSVWNIGLERRNLWNPDRAQKVTTASQKGELAEARKAFTWLTLGSSSIQQAALRDLDRRFNNWWGNPNHFHRPTWRKVGVNEGFYVRDHSLRRLNRSWGEVLVPKSGWIRFRFSRPRTEIESSTSARITLDRRGRWHTSFAKPKPEFQRERSGAEVGLDMGVFATFTTSDGEHLAMPKLLSPAQSKRKRRLQRKMVRRKKGSNRRDRTRLSIAKLSAKEFDHRRDWLEKTTTMLVQDYDLIVIENLRVKNMVRFARGTDENLRKNVAQKRGLNMAISAQVWSTFRKRLSDKATIAVSPVELVVVNPRFTSQTCPQGHRAAQNRKSQTVFARITCGYEANADLNAARSILAAGMVVAGRRGTPQAKPNRAKRSGPVKRQPLDQWHELRFLGNPPDLSVRRRPTSEI